MKKNLKLVPILHLAHGAHGTYLTCNGKRSPCVRSRWLPKVCIIAVLEEQKIR